MRFYPLFVAFVCLVVGCSSKPVKAPTRLSPREKAPPFVLTDMLTSEQVMTGKLFSENNATVLVFWSMACPVCRQALIEIDELYKAYRGKAIAFLAINFDIENLHGVRAFVKGEKLEMPVLLDRRATVTKSYKAYDYTFSLFVVDREGRLVLVQYDHAPDLKVRLKELLDQIIIGK